MCEEIVQTGWLNLRDSPQGAANTSGSSPSKQVLADLASEQSMPAINTEASKIHQSAAESMSDAAGFELLGELMGDEVEAAIKMALAAGAVFPIGTDPLTIFRRTIDASICRIEDQDRGGLFKRLLMDGPWEGDEQGAPSAGKRSLSARETATAVALIYSFMVNSFKGAVTEILAAAACQKLLQDPRIACNLPSSARLYVGDAVMVRRKSGDGVLKGADLHVLVSDGRNRNDARVVVVGVVEVKSGHKSSDALRVQVQRHISRVKQGLRLGNRDFPRGKVKLGYGAENRILRITVQPSDWPLPRKLRFQTVDGIRQLILDPPVPPSKEDQFDPLSRDRWHIWLRWSKEAIAAAAYEMTFWYMEKVGEVLYARNENEPDPKPKGWEDMDAAAAGRNAIKMMLYYAIRPYAIKQNDGTLTKDEARVMQRAIAVYNTYGFGYALGMNFRNKARRREMLWPQDLDEIAENGCNRDGCRIFGPHVSS